MGESRWPTQGEKPLSTFADVKILVIRFSSIGDIILTSPVLRCIKQQVPGVELHYLTKKAFAPLVEHSPYVDKVHVVEEDLGAAIRALKKERFDRVVDLHHNLRTWRVKRALGMPASSFPKMNVEKWLMVNMGREPENGLAFLKTLLRKKTAAAIERLKEHHIVDRYLSTVEHLGVKNDGVGLELHIPTGSDVALNTLPESHRSGYTALCIGAAHFTKRLPPNRLIELAQLLQGPVVIIGGPEDRPVAGQIANAVGGRAFDATGRYDLLGSASLIKQARSVIAHDSGAMHVAAAFQKNVVSMWGNTVPAFGMQAYIPQHPERSHIAEVQGLSCRPCSKIGHDHCPKGHFHCMQQQDLRWIAARTK